MDSKHSKSSSSNPDLLSNHFAESIVNSLYNTEGLAITASDSAGTSDNNSKLESPPTSVSSAAIEMIPNPVAPPPPKVPSSSPSTPSTIGYGVPTVPNSLTDASPDLNNTTITALSNGTNIPSPELEHITRSLNVTTGTSSTSFWKPVPSTYPQRKRSAASPSSPSSISLISQITGSQLNSRWMEHSSSNDKDDNNKGINPGLAHNSPPPSPSSLSSSHRSSNEKTYDMKLIPFSSIGYTTENSPLPSTTVPIGTNAITGSGSSASIATSEHTMRASAPVSKPMAHPSVSSFHPAASRSAASFPKPTEFLPRPKNHELYGPSGSFDFVGAASSASSPGLTATTSWYNQPSAPSSTEITNRLTTGQGQIFPSASNPPMSRIPIDPTTACAPISPYADAEMQRVQMELNEARLEIKRLSSQLDSIRPPKQSFSDEVKQLSQHLSTESFNDIESQSGDGSSSAGISAPSSTKWYTSYLHEEHEGHRRSDGPERDRGRLNSISSTSGYSFSMPSPSTRVISTSQPSSYVNALSPVTTSSATMNAYDSDYGYDQFAPQLSSIEGFDESTANTASAVAAGLVEPTEVYYPIKYYNEPLNYRKLGERNVGCNWKLIIDRIVQDNDQQASIFLQQKLKSATKTQKSAIIAAIVEQSFLLMINRFGNFLVQRCFEYGSPQEVSGITRSMTGHIVKLAMDPFGCHVIQKTLDCVSTDDKFQIIEEMLCNVKETMVHRYACHVWQKLFELRWDESATPRFMRKVNLDLNGSWVEVAQGETGSLVVQNIFENCTEEDKKPCIDEIINNLDTVIRGQWGNWVIQHMVEHASEPYRRTVINMIIESAAIYSVDQFASKTVEKMLKMGAKDIIQAFLNKVIEKRPDRPRIPLIDSMKNCPSMFRLLTMTVG